MHRFLLLTASVALIALSWCVVEAALAVRAWRGIPDRVLMLTNDHLTTMEGVADSRLASVEASASAQLAATRSEVLARVDTLTWRADTRLGEAVAIMDSRSREIQQDVAAVGRDAAGTARAATGLLESVQPTVDAVNDLSPSVMRNTLGLIAASKVTAGEAAQTMRTVRDAAPEIASSIQASATASQQAALSAAQTSDNLARLTKPGPPWLRYLGMGLQIAGPASQLAMPIVIGNLATKGSIK